LASASGAQLLRTPHGNSCGTASRFCDAATVELIQGLGGIKGIAIFAPALLFVDGRVEQPSAACRSICMTPTSSGSCVTIGHRALERVARRKSFLPGVTLICVGGHLSGGVVLHWEQGPLLPRRAAVGRHSFRSLPTTIGELHVELSEFIPLSAPAVERIVRILKPPNYDRVHGAFNDRTVWSDGKGVVERSAARYLSWIRANAGNSPAVTFLRLARPRSDLEKILAVGHRARRRDRSCARARGLRGLVGVPVPERRQQPAPGIDGSG